MCVIHSFVLAGSPLVIYGARSQLQILLRKRDKKSRRGRWCEVFSLLRGIQRSVEARNGRVRAAQAAVDEFPRDRLELRRASARLRLDPLQLK